MLEIRNLFCHYGKIAAVRDVSLSVRAWEPVALVGSYGAGKSTTLKAVAGLLEATAGRIMFEGEDIAKVSTGEVLRQGIALCPEGRRVFPHMNVRENLELGAYQVKSRQQIDTDIALAFERFPRLRERGRQVAGTLSGGEQQMLAIGRALMSRPKLVLFDEPSLGLAPNLVDQVFDIITAIRDEGTTVLMVEQNAYAALEMCDRAYLLESGELRLEGTGQQLLGEDYVRKFYLGG